jgi:hypothetical protein
VLKPKAEKPAEAPVASDGAADEAPAADAADEAPVAGETTTDEA